MNHLKNEQINAKNKFLLISTFLMLFFSSCYSVNDRRTLDITFPDNKLNADFVENYLDKIYNRGIVIPDSIKNVFFDTDTIPNNERLVYFKDKPQEWYLVIFNSSPGWIEAIYNHQLSPGRISDRLFISQSELTRIKKRFETEILVKADEYGEAHHISNFRFNN